MCLSLCPSFSFSFQNLSFFFLCSVVKILIMFRFCLSFSSFCLLCEYYTSESLCLFSVFSLLVWVWVCWLRVSVFFLLCCRFGYDKSSLTRKITKIMKKKFNKPFYSWTCVPRDRQEGYFVEFAVTFFIFYIQFIVLSVVKRNIGK